MPVGQPYSTLLIGWWSYGNSSDTVTPTEASAFCGTAEGDQIKGNYVDELSKAKGKEVVCLCRLSADDEPLASHKGRSTSANPFDYCRQEREKSKRRT